MYKVDGIKLQKGEYDLLRKLVDDYDSDVSMSPFLERYNGSYADGRIDEAFKGLLKKKMVDGYITDERIRLKRITQKGLDFIHDFDAKKLEEETTRKIQFRHDYKVALFGIVAGGLLGFIGGLFSSDIKAAFFSIFG